ncbi:hypothetical protein CAUPRSCDRAFT_12405 [Caulochytrium protostelioides]|uniref:Uncharacterized protein n=1 Tax=Caulochytrium protostelioides TaxID=1555241 RepID=A0A4P9WTY6_9FUNG|nr:hypothetical protein CAUPRSCDRAFT_12405 [Caulochytrium protostelioides]
MTPRGYVVQPADPVALLAIDPPLFEFFAGMLLMVGGLIFTLSARDVTNALRRAGFGVLSAHAHGHGHGHDNGHGHDGALGETPGTSALGGISLDAAAVALQAHAAAEKVTQDVIFLVVLATTGLLAILGVVLATAVWLQALKRRLVRHARKQVLLAPLS